VLKGTKQVHCNEWSTASTAGIGNIIANRTTPISSFYNGDLNCVCVI